MCRIADVGDVHFNQIFDVEASHADITCFYEVLLNSEIAPLSAGGDHSITLPILRAMFEVLCNLAEKINSGLNKKID